MLGRHKAARAESNCTLALRRPPAALRSSGRDIFRCRCGPGPPGRIVRGGTHREGRPRPRRLRERRLWPRPLRERRPLCPLRPWVAAWKACSNFHELSTLCNISANQGVRHVSSSKGTPDVNKIPILLVQKKSTHHG